MKPLCGCLDTRVQLISIDRISIDGIFRMFNTAVQLFTEHTHLSKNRSNLDTLTIFEFIILCNYGVTLVLSVLRCWQWTMKMICTAGFEIFNLISTLRITLRFLVGMTNTSNGTGQKLSQRDKAVTNCFSR